MKLAIIGVMAVPRAAGHGAMQMPQSWMDPAGRYGMKAGTQCVAGCTGNAPGAREPATRGCACEWYSNWTHIPRGPTIPRGSPLRTYTDWDFGDGLLQDWTARNPWRAPGTAPVFSPCGVDGGNPRGCPMGNPDPHGCAVGGYGLGPDARAYYPEFPEPATTVWQRGTIVEAAWGIAANHGGGYSYRLCPRPATMMELSEECFQGMVLNFVGDTQWVQFGNDSKNRTVFRAMRTTTGTYPTGSMWTRNPIPACEGPGGVSLAGPGQKCGTGPWGNITGGVQFPPPFPYGYGYGTHDPTMPGADGFGVFHWSIVDRLRLPATLTPGEYVLSWRWDAEQSPQVWSSCANVRITGADNLV